MFDESQYHNVSCCQIKFIKKFEKFKEKFKLLVILSITTKKIKLFVY